MTAESFHNIPIIFASSLARCKTQGMVRPHKYCIFHQNPTHADLVGMVDSCLTTSLPWWLPFSYSAFLSQNWELLGQAPLVSIQWSCIVIRLTQNPFTLSTLVDHLWFPPIQFILLTGCPLGSDTSCKSLFRELWCHAACARCSQNGRKRPGNHLNGSSDFRTHVDFIFGILQGMNLHALWPHSWACHKAMRQPICGNNKRSV